MNLNRIIALVNTFYSIAKLRGAMDIRHFKNIDHPLAAIYYAQVEAGLELLGEGSSRKTYLLSSKYAVKIAKNPAGISQNRQEAMFAADPRFSGIVANVSDFHDKFIWIIVELVRPLQSEAEFMSLTGMGYYDFTLYVSGKRGEERVGNIPLFAARLRKLVQDKVISVVDATKLDSLGKTSDGRVVLLDYGLTSAIYHAFYQEGFAKKPSFENLEFDSDEPEKTPDSFEAQEVPTAVQIPKAI